jgi:hypothetical protein
MIHRIHLLLSADAFLGRFFFQKIQSHLPEKRIVFSGFFRPLFIAILVHRHI